MNIDSLNAWMKSLSHNYVLISAAAVLFFGAKFVAGYFTYRRIRRDLAEIKSLVRERNHTSPGPDSPVNRP
ncbi:MULTISPECIES: hypothetical protein [Paenibacillus]|uniref:hypothetical protein n=1 Tax=Paenibacillus TaxID=44249 RepID=UPI0022B88F48|nr:hypothetical protein [Paenibacillus caseinilyticus]MCZ8522895.1 hypothetical protein [Paenibacillus caseinilyticus]